MTRNFRAIDINGTLTVSMILRLIYSVLPSSRGHINSKFNNNIQIVLMKKYYRSKENMFMTFNATNEIQNSFEQTMKLYTMRY